MREMPKPLSWEQSPEPGKRRALRDFQRDLYLATSSERKAVERRRDLDQLRQPYLLTNLPDWRKLLVRCNQHIRDISQQLLEKKDFKLLERKPQAIADYNRHIRLLEHEGVRGLPPKFPEPESLDPETVVTEKTVALEPKSLDPREAHLAHIYHLDFPSGKPREKQPSDYLDVLKDSIDDLKPKVPGAISIEAKRQKRISDELVRTHNRWIERFGKPENWKLPEDGLKGGGFYLGDDPLSGELSACFMTLRTPDGAIYHAHAGEFADDIAEYTSQWATGKSVAGADGAFRPMESLTEDEAGSLDRGVSIKGWECLDQWWVPVRIRTVYTDKGTPMTAIDNIPYVLPPFEGLPNTFRGTVVMDSEGYHADCHGKTFLKGRGILWDRIQTVLEENGYTEVPNHLQAQRGDIWVYREEGNITHTATVGGWFKTNPQSLGPARLDQRPTERWGQSYRLLGYSKLGHDVVAWHDMTDPYIVEEYGQPTIYRTNRAEGNTLIED